MTIKRVVLVVALAAAVGIVLKGCGDDDSGGDPTEYSCTDGRDNDNDGQTDCDDTECASNPACTGSGETNCDDLVDNDNDGQTDCDDTDCANDPACGGGGETNCTNNIDDDNDTYTDCDDADCTNDPACGGTTETNCTNNIDDDNDTYTDCDDADCTNDPACGGGGETNCTNNIDDDNDTYTDCADSDCANDQACQGNGALGDSCSADGQCTPPAGLTAVCLLDQLIMVSFPGGYCSADCDSNDPSSCGAGATCFGVGGFIGYCLKTCASNSECREAEQYTCTTPPIGGTVDVCWPPGGIGP